jgi:hypothetical protein
VALVVDSSSRRTDSRGLAVVASEVAVDLQR